MKTCYYAHSIHLYGTEQEKRDIAMLEAMGFKVVNPNAPEHDGGYKRDGMAYFSNIVAGCDVLAFRANPGGTVNAGVFKEISWARSNDKPVLQLPSWASLRELSVDDTRDMLKELGQR